VDAALPAAFDHPGWVLGDPHSHASPSSDAAIPMEDRLIVAAGVGIQVHFGTDHDHLADYRPLLDPLGLAPVLKSVVADEVSPPLRGHFNIYPVEPTPGEPDNGAWEWWAEIPASTEAMVDTLRARHGDGFVLQSNHPTSSGLASSASWDVGVVDKGDFWTDRIEAAEVLNSGDYASFLGFWEDLVGRGYRVTPVGVSDSHSHFGGSVGWSATWLDVGTDDVTAVTDDLVASAIRDGRVVVSRGPFLALDRDPGATVAPGTRLAVEARSASWVKVDRIHLIRDGVEVQAVDGTSATFDLDATEDAWFAVIADGATPMLPVTGDTPWAMAGPFRVDVGADGWSAPLPPMDIR
ncbi:MAG: CehA/McbA family metallohydrolase, partial [Myxococcota bacterium]